MMDYLIKNANLYVGGTTVLPGMDVAVKDGCIAKTGQGLDMEAAAVEDAAGCLLTPSFVDAHMHIDESFTMDDDATLSLLAAIDNQEKCNLKYFDATHDALLAMMLRNAGRVVEMCAQNGTTLIKTNVLFTPAWKTTALEAMMLLRARYREICSIKTCCGFPFAFEKELDAAAARGMIDFVSGYPYMDEDYWLTIDRIFSKAERFGLPIDIHCGESDVPDLNCFLYLLEKTKEVGMQGRVCCGHLTALSAVGVEEAQASRAIRMAGELRLHVATLTSCNLYLMGTNRRGPTRVRDLMEAGANVCIGSDNIRDTFRPYGNCDLLEEALLTAKVHKFCSNEELRKVFSMITFNGARNALLSRYGLEEGCTADMVLLDAPTPEAAIVDQSEKLCVWKNGKLISRRRKLTC